MAGAFLPLPALPSDGSFPRIVERWAGMRIDPKHLAAFRAAIGARDDDSVCVLYPHVLGFRLQMALLTHPAFPLPIWNALQVRNRLLRHRAVEPGATFEMDTRTARHQRVDKGLEVELHIRLSQGTELLWESSVTYFYRGRFGASARQVQPAPPPSWSVCELRVQAGGRSAGLRATTTAFIAGLGTHAASVSAPRSCTRSALRGCAWRGSTGRDPKRRRSSCGSRGRCVTAKKPP